MPDAPVGAGTPERQVVDIHAHLFPPAVVELFRSDRGGRVEVTERAGVPGIRLDGRVLHATIPPAMLDVDAHVAGMDTAGVRVHAVSIPPPMLYWAEPSQALDIAQAANDSLTGLASAYPERLVPVGSLPLQDVPSAIDEMQRIVRDLGHRTVMLGSNIDGTELDDPRLHDFYAEAERLDVALFVHPILPGAVAERMHDYRLDMGFGMIADTTLAAARVISSGLMDRHPGLRFSWSHLGGTLPYTLGRIEHVLGNLPGTEYRAAEPFRSYIDRFWFDTVVYSDEMLAAGLAFARPSRLMFGTDSPFLGDSTTHIRAIIERSPVLTDDDRTAIFSGTAMEFLRLDRGDFTG